MGIFIFGYRNDFLRPDILIENFYNVVNVKPCHESRWDRFFNFQAILKAMSDCAKVSKIAKYVLPQELSETNLA